MEKKTVPAFVTKAYDDEGIVDCVFALFGNVDEGKDRMWPGSFTKTFAERGLDVKVLDAHNMDSCLDVVGKPLELRELGEGDLPAQLKSKCPDATGGAFAKIQFLMDTPEGKGVFLRLKAGALSEWSFGYDALDFDYEDVKLNGEDTSVRNLRTVKLYEVSPVIWGLNPETMTLGAKAGEPSEGKPAPDVTENTIRIRVRDPGDFQDDSFRTITIGDEAQGIQAVIGKPKGEDSTEVQSYVFDKDKWTPEKAQAWVDEHKKDALPDLDEKQDGASDEKQTYSCECLDCGHKVESDEHCRDIECPECGGEMRRAERPGPGKSGGLDTETKVGRVLSAANAGKLVSALTTILDVLERAGVDVPGYDKQPQKTPPKESGKAAEDVTTGADSTVADEEKTDPVAGPAEPPTMSGQLRLKRELIELELLEVRHQDMGGK